MGYTDTLSYFLVVEHHDDGNLMRARFPGHDGLEAPVRDACVRHFRTGGGVSVISSHYADGRMGYVGRIEKLRYYVVGGQVYRIDDSGVPADAGMAIAWKAEA